jgi:hypothetical protein
MTLNGEKIKNKVVVLDNIYNFVVKNIFIWCRLGS